MSWAFIAATNPVFVIATDARVIDRLANHPDIFPFIAPKDAEALAFGSFFNDERMAKFRFYHSHDETIGMFFDWSSPQVWELHMMATPETRGGDALAFAIEVIGHMFEHDAREIWGQTPVWNERARKMHRKVGGISRGFGQNPLFGEVEYFATARSEWKPVSLNTPMQNNHGGR